MLLFLSSFVKVSQRVEELLSEHDLTDRQTYIQTDIQTTMGKTICLPPDEGNIIIRIERTRFVTDRQTMGKTICLPQIRGT